jgi:galactokinase
MLTASSLFVAFEQRYGYRPRLIVRAPGRVNLIGEHTDYNDGFVLPIAIDRAAYVAARARDDDLVQVHSVTFNQDDSFHLNQIEYNTEKPWSNYVRGVVKALLARIPEMHGANVIIDGDVPLGSGLSSSAAIEVATGYTFQLLNDLNLLGEELALLCQGAENAFVGVRCGIMDQFTSALGQAGHALFLDCRDLTYQAVPIPPDVKIVVCSSGIDHTHSNSKYNQRRRECDDAVHILKAHKPKMTALRDVNLEEFERWRGDLPRKLQPRVRHVITENQRVLDSVAALQAGDLQRFGQLMYESHASLRDNYEVSIPELDHLVEIASRVPGCYGSRLTGGGFGGSTVSLVANEAVERFTAQVKREYLAATGIETAVHVCVPSDGVGRA